MGLSHEAQWCTPTALAVKSAHDAVEVKEPEHRVVGSAAKSSPRRSQALMRSSRKQVASASHAVPEVRFADHISPRSAGSSCCKASCWERSLRLAFGRACDT